MQNESRLHIHRLPKARALLGQFNQPDHLCGFVAAGRQLALSGEGPGEFAVVLGPRRGLDGGSDFADRRAIADSREGA